MKILFGSQLGKMPQITKMNNLSLDIINLKKVHLEKIACGKI